MKMYTKLKYLPIAAVAAVALSLAGCGGGDDDPVATSPTPPMEIEPAACEGTAACLAEAMTTLADARAALSALEASQDSTLGQVTAAKAAVTAAVTALAAAQTAHDVYLAATSPTPPMEIEPAACEGTAACLAEAMTTLADARAALSALEASQDSTLGQVTAAKAAVTAAVTALAAAQTAHDVYLAATSPTPPMEIEPAACEGTAACLAEAMTTLADARAALSALEASQDSTLGQVTAAKAAVTAAVTALAAAQTAHDDYVAMQPAPVPSVAELFVTAQAASDAATDAGDAATKAVKDAMDASVKLSTMSVNGDSMAATANARAVMNAQDTAAQAVIDAQAALDDAMAAKVHADALADDDASKDGLAAALDAAIVVAEAQLKIATDASDGDELGDAVAEVTGDDEDEPMSPSDHGKTVAMAIGQALGGGESTASALPRPDPAIGAGVPSLAVMNVVRMDDHQGKTWAEIVGETMKMRIAGAADTTTEVDAASVDGMTLTSMQPPAEEVVDGTQVTQGIDYKGIPGTVFCAGSDCAVDGDADNEVATLTGSWYFTPTSRWNGTSGPQLKALRRMHQKPCTRGLATG